MRKVVMISLDALAGSDPARFGPEAPINTLLRESACCRRVETVFPALTYPIHVTMVTGCDPDKTGVGHNQPLQPDVPAPNRVWNWNREDVRVPTLFEAVRDEGGSCCSILWPVNCRNSAVRWLFPEVHTLPGENTVWKVLTHGSPLFILYEELNYGKLRNGSSEPELSDYAAAAAMDVLRRRAPDFTALHLIDIDYTRHHHGAFSAEADAAIERCGRRVQEIRKTILEIPEMRDALLVLVSDHGQEDVERIVNIRDILKASGLDGQIIAQSNGMSACFFPGPEYRRQAHPESLLTPEIRSKAGISRVYSREDLDRMHAVKEPLFAAEAAPGVMFTDDDQEEPEKANHGFGPGRDADYCLFAVLGRGVREGAVIPEMRMRDVGPTVAGLIGLSLPQADGMDLSSFFIR